LSVIILDFHESVHRDTIMKGTNKMQLYRLIYYYKSALRVSDDVSPIIGSTCLYLQYLVVFTQAAAGWCLEWFSTQPRHQSL